jgi:putative ABC transport system permease protein
MYMRLIVTNLSRHRVRSLISVAGIAFSVAAMLAVITILQGAVGMFSNILSSDSQIIVFEKDVSDLFFSNVPVHDAVEMAAWPQVERANPVLFGVVTSGSQPIITCFGVEADDARLKKATWTSGNPANFGSDENGVVLGERAAAFLSASVGDLVPIGHARFRVVGILKTSNGFEDGGVFMPLKAAQNYFHKEQMSSAITVKLKNRDDAAEFKRRVARQYPEMVALEDEEFSRSYSQFRILKATAWAVGGCGLLLGGLGVANTMIMSVFTRIREIAILRAVGFSRAQIGRLVLGESIAVSALGAAAGLLIGTVALNLLKAIPALHGYVDASPHPRLMAVVAALALLTGLAGAIYPMVYAVRVRSVEALRFE